MADKQSLKAIFAADHSKREATLTRARECSALTKAWVLPPLDQTDTDNLPQSFNSIGALGVTNMLSRMMMSLWPPDSPWFQLDLDPEIKYGDKYQPEQLHQAQEALFRYELLINAVLESSNFSPRRSGRRLGFRTAKLRALNQLVVTGDSLEQLTDDYRIKVFRRDRYVTARDSAGDVLYHIIEEKVDPLSLTEEQLAKSELDVEDLKNKTSLERMQTMYTRTEWDPINEEWVVEQELNEKIINESREKVSQFFSTAWELPEEEDYGRGWVELNIGDLRSHDRLRERLLDFAALASKHLLVKDASSLIRNKDLKQDTGGIIEGGRVVGGQVQDVAFLKADKMNDFQVVYQTNESVRKDLGKALNFESEVTPRGDRVTATQAQRIGLENELMTGGSYSSIAEEQQVPLLRRVVYQLQRDGIIPPIDQKFIDFRPIAGIHALNAEITLQKVMSAVQALSTNPATARYIRESTLVDLTFRYSGIYEPDLVKSRAEVEQEIRQEMEAQAAMEAAKQAASAGGQIAVNEHAAQQAQGQA